jgi:hypothetical protein
MKPLNLLRTMAALIGIISVFFGFAPHARADLADTLAEEKALKAKVYDLEVKVSIQKERVDQKDGIPSVTLSVLRDYEKQLAKAEKSLRGVQAKIARQRSDVAKDAAKDAAKTAAQQAARDATMAAAKDAARTGARDAAKDAAKSASKTASKDSSKDASHGAAKSAAHPPPPSMHHAK